MLHYLIWESMSAFSHLLVRDWSDSESDHLWGDPDEALRDLACIAQYRLLWAARRIAVWLFRRQTKRQMSASGSALYLAGVIVLIVRQKNEIKSWGSSA